MPTPIDELVDELKRFKPDSPALRHFTVPELKRSQLLHARNVVALLEQHRADAYDAAEGEVEP